MRFTEEMINEDEKRWHARNVVTELRYCGNYMCDRKDMKNTDIRFYAYIMRKAYYMLKEQPEIVRCKDCRKNMMCELTINKPKDWFCADGVAKDINVPGKEGGELDD